MVVRHFQNHKCEPHGGAKQGVMGSLKSVDPSSGDPDVFTNFHSNPSNNCWRCFCTNQASCCEPSEQNCGQNNQIKVFTNINTDKQLVAKAELLPLMPFLLQPPVSVSAEPPGGELHKEVVYRWAECRSFRVSSSPHKNKQLQSEGGIKPSTLRTGGHSCQWVMVSLHGLISTVRAPVTSDLLTPPTLERNQGADWQTSGNRDRKRNFVPLDRWLFFKKQKTDIKQHQHPGGFRRLSFLEVMYFCFPGRDIQ